MTKSVSNEDIMVVRCTVIAVSNDVPYILASEGPDKRRYAVNEKVSGALWGHFYRGQLLDIHLIRVTGEPSKLLAVYPVTDENA